MILRKFLKLMNKMIIIASGPIDHLQYFKPLLERNKVIAVDGGLNHLHKLGIKPEVLIGDFDSIDTSLLELSKDIPVYEHPTRKDFTDSEIAIDYVINQSPDEVILMGVTGHRIDHMITNINLLKRFVNRGILAYVLDYHNKVYYCNSDIELEGNVGDLLSIVPLTSSVHKIKTYGLEYPLDDETLYFHESSGVSNVFSEPKVRIETGSGEFLIILSKD